MKRERGYQTRVALFLVLCGIFGTLRASSQDSPPRTQIAAYNDLGRLSAGPGHLINASTDMRSLSGADVIWLVTHPEQVHIERPSKAEEKGNKWYKLDWAALDICNGEREPDSTVIQTGYQGACIRVADHYEYTVANRNLVPSNPANTKRFEALIRYCYWATKSNSTDIACGRLAEALMDIGNFSAGKAVLKYAPGCHTTRLDGEPSSGCFLIAFGAEQIKTQNGAELVKMGREFPEQLVAGLATITPADLLFIAEPACNLDLDARACSYTKSHGGRVQFNDEQLREIADRDSNYLNWLQGWVQQRNQERERRAVAQQQEFENRMNVLNGLANQTNSAVLDAGNQQGAAIRAIGDDNAAAQQQAAEARLAAQKAAQDAAQQRAAAQQAAQQSQQTSEQKSSSGGNNRPTLNGNSSGSAGNGSAGGSDAIYFAPITQNCIREFWDPQHYNWLSFENDCGQAIHLTFIAKSPNDHFGAAATDLAAGQATNTGWSKADVDAKGNFAMFICPAGSVAVDASTDQAITSPNANYHCKKQ
ncbi:MAG TPA: hypothetical protein VKP58_16590 [Candidatus Acidoferrum sp.]|nr:hypothetical protein [Candidatus Acidoferrum sp.]